jgi:hypothetical protein
MAFLLDCSGLDLEFIIMNPIFVRVVAVPLVSIYLG